MSERSLGAAAITAFLAAWIVLAGLDESRAQGRGAAEEAPQDPVLGEPGETGPPPEAPPPTPEASATVDLTGYWVSLVTEDWHWRMSLPERGDVSSIPFTDDEEKRAILEAWDPAEDEANGDQCKAYGAAAIMRLPTRVRITWENGSILKLETDAGMQTRLFRFDDEADARPGEPSLQGFSIAEWWQPPGGRGRGGPGRGGRGGGGAEPPEPGPGGSLQVVTTNLAPGYLRKNGVPYSGQARVTEYYHRTPETYGNTYMIVTTIVEDPEYLTGPFVTSSHFMKLPDTGNGWNPEPCSAF